MATVGAALVGYVFGQSAAEKAFRPWWDKMQDNMIYGLILMSLLDPFSLITVTPLECSQCTNGLERVGVCKDNMNAAGKISATHSNFNNFWVKIVWMQLKI